MDRPALSTVFGVPLGVFNIVSHFNIALQVQPQILTFLSLVTWIQCYYYERRWSISKALVVVIPVACVMGGIEAGLVFALRVGIRHGIDWPPTLMAVLAALFLALGVLEQYVAIYKHRSVEGISFLFCGIDALGDLTSTIAVVFEPKISVSGLVIYNVEFVMWMGIFACGGYYKLLPALKRQIKRRRSAGDASRTSNELRFTSTSSPQRLQPTTIDRAMDSEQQQQKGMTSGETTPDYSMAPKATSSIFFLHRNDSQETITSTSITEIESVASTQSRIYPAPPLNSPMTLSEVGDRELPNADSLADKLHAMPQIFVNFTPPTSVSDTKEGVERIPRSERETMRTPTKSLGTKTPPTKDLFPEHSNWANVAEEDVISGLKRLTMLARDEHKVDPSRTVEEIYSERLAKLLKACELQFDQSKLL
ncbi:hypothetical protein LTR29_001514 [Friedmanniomyces endolithicus]|nr:hypothetical protein LTR29_001514 [Friedmanniomyces endolithicus]